MEEIREKYSDIVEVYFDTVCEGISLIEDDLVEVRVKPISRIHDLEAKVRTPPTDSISLKTKFLIGADGANSAVRRSLLQINNAGKMNFFRKNYVDKNPRLYRTIPLYLPSKTKEERNKWLDGWALSCRTKTDVNLEGNNRFYTTLLY